MASGACSRVRGSGPSIIRAAISFISRSRCWLPRSRFSFPPSPGTMSMSFLFVLIGVAEFSLGETLLMGCLGMLVQTVYHAKKRPKAVQVAFSVASMACSVQIAYGAYRLFGLQSTILSAAAFFVANTLFVATVIALTEEKNVWQVWRDSYFWTFPNYLVGAAAAWVVAVAERLAGWQAALLLMPIFYVVYRSHSLYVGRLEEGEKTGGGSARARRRSGRVASPHHRDPGDRHRSQGPDHARSPGARGNLRGRGRQRTRLQRDGAGSAARGGAAARHRQDRGAGIHHFEARQADAGRVRENEDAHRGGRGTGGAHPLSHTPWRRWCAAITKNGTAPVIRTD